MDRTTFATVTRSLRTVVSRRSALHGLVAGALAVTAGSDLPETSARRRTGKGTGKGKGKKGRSLRPGDRCQTTKQCRAIDDAFLCAPTRLFSDERVCCGGLDALCDETGGTRPCCSGSLCASGRCLVV
jgi:hypothetical protein